MQLRHFFLDKIAHSSYMLAGKHTCAVVDPRRDVDIYISEARAMGVTITHILETHLHADFVSGHIELASRTGAQIYAPISGNCKFDHIPVTEGDSIKIEDIQLDVLETPGHTPEHVVYVATDQLRGAIPLGAFVGDVLFVGDAGRPDLFPDMAGELAGKLYDSLHEKLLKLPDYCEIYPAHGAGSLCGRSIGGKWTTTLGYERNTNPVLQIKDRAEFIHSLTSNMPPAPDHFSRCSEINRNGPELISKLPPIEELGPKKFSSEVQDSRNVVLDVRDPAAFAGFHIPGSWHIDLNINFPTYAGWVLPADKEILIVADNSQEVAAAVLWARRVGLDRVAAYLGGGMAAWVNNGYQVDHLHTLSGKDLRKHLTESTAALLLVDVRDPQEFSESHIEGAINIPAPDLRRRHEEIPQNQPVYLICSTGSRSSLAASILEQHGFKEIYNIAGGMTGYNRTAPDEQLENKQ